MIKVYALIIAILLIYYLARWLLPGAGQSVLTPLPGRLKGAAIWAKERAFRINSPVAIHGVLDEAFKLEDGTVVLSDSKSRPNKAVYRSDILQVSILKLLVEQGAGEVVSDRGYVRILSPNGNEYVPINLVGSEAVIAAAELHAQLIAGTSIGEKCSSPGLCRKCPYKRPCDEMAY